MSLVRSSRWPNFGSLLLDGLASRMEHTVSFLSRNLDKNAKAARTTFNSVLGAPNYGHWGKQIHRHIRHFIMDGLLDVLGICAHCCVFRAWTCTSFRSSLTITDATTSTAIAFSGKR